MYSKPVYSIAVDIEWMLAENQLLPWPISLSIIMHNQQEKLRMTLEPE
jgi:hypothetical protein